MKIHQHAQSKTSIPEYLQGPLYELFISSKFDEKWHSKTASVPSTSSNHYQPPPTLERDTMPKTTKQSGQIVTSSRNIIIQIVRRDWKEKDGKREINNSTQRDPQKNQNPKTHTRQRSIDGQLTMTSFGLCRRRLNARQRWPLTVPLHQHCSSCRSAPFN